MAFPTTEMPGHETLRDRVRAALDRLIEAPDVDFKQSAEWEALRVKIIKGVLAMGNLRDGGIIVVGVAERGHNWELEGISDAHLATYETDIVHDSLDQYVSPASNVEVVLHEHNGKRYLVFHVHEFEALPFICKKDGEGLIRGGMYVRPAAGRPRTERIQSAEDMRDLLSLASEKGARRILEQMRRLDVAPPPDVIRERGMTDYDRELGEL
jgi:predicted HTH transcriptional regulator